VKIIAGLRCSGGPTPDGKCNWGQWEDDGFVGAELTAMVADTCVSNMHYQGLDWCINDYYHLNIQSSGLKLFKKNGVTVDLSNNWNNRNITWYFVPNNVTKEIHFTYQASSYSKMMALKGFDNGFLKVY
jgi:hypothetical protein